MATVEDVKKAFEFLNDAGVDLKSYDGIHDGYLSIYEMVLEIFGESNINYDDNVSEVIEKVFKGVVR